MLVFVILKGVYSFNFIPLIDFEVKNIFGKTHRQADGKLKRDKTMLYEKYLFILTKEIN